MKKLIFILLCFCLMTFGSSAKIIEVAPAGAWGVLGISGGGAVAAGGGECSVWLTKNYLTSDDYYLGEVGETNVYYALQFVSDGVPSDVIQIKTSLCYGNQPEVGHTITGYIYADSSGPTGGVLATSSNTIDPRTVSSSCSSPSEACFLFNYTPSATTTYNFVLKIDSIADYATYIALDLSSGTNYLDSYKSTNGADWTLEWEAAPYVIDISSGDCSCE